MSTPAGAPVAKRSLDRFEFRTEPLPLSGALKHSSAGYASPTERPTAPRRSETIGEDRPGDLPPPRRPLMIVSLTPASRRRSRAVA